MKISRVLHAGYIFEHNGTKIIFDPIFENPFSTNCYAFPDVKFDPEHIKAERFDAVFISHFHDDHCSLESLNLINKETPIYLFCLHEELYQLIRELGFKKVVPLVLDIPVVIAGFEVIPRRALDEDVDSIFHIRADGLNILNVVDSWIGPSTLEVLRKTSQWDLILWPFQVMRELEVLAPEFTQNQPTELPPEWIEQLQLLKPKLLVPSSCQFKFEQWSWYNKSFFGISYADFAKAVSAAIPETQVLRLDPLCSFELGSKGITSSLPETATADYEFDPHNVPQATSEISKMFPSLTPAQARRVEQYCETELPKIISELEEPESDFFSGEKNWQLSLYDENGIPRHFYFESKGARLNIRADLPPELDWQTEVPLFKLYQALENGEALTSMYVRLNFFKKPKQFELYEIVEDPLLRGLFSRDVASYQRAQLKRLVRPKGAL